MVAIVISAGMTAPAGVFYAFYYNNLFPEQTFFILRSIEIILGPIIGGVGTLFGPVIGAFLISGLSEGLQSSDRLGIETPGAKRVFTAFAFAGGDGVASDPLVKLTPKAARAIQPLSFGALLESLIISSGCAVADDILCAGRGDLRGDPANGAGKTTFSM
jgi:ABC-type branched-subunit amino acid transport system permease subunit